MNIQQIPTKLPSTFSGLFLWIYLILLVISFFSIAQVSVAQGQISTTLWFMLFMGIVGTTVGAVMHYWVERYLEDKLERYLAGEHTIIEKYYAS